MSKPFLGISLLTRAYGDPYGKKYPVYNQSTLDIAVNLLEQNDLDPSYVKVVKSRISRIAKELKLKIDNSKIGDTVLSQDSGFGEYEGSLNDRISDVCSAFDRWKRENNLRWSWCEAVFDNFVLVRQYGKASPETGYYGDSYGYVMEDKGWKVPYTYGSGDVVSFGDPVEIRVRTIIETIDSGEMSVEDEEAEDQSVEVHMEKYLAPKGWDLLLQSWIDEEIVENKQQSDEGTVDLVQTFSSSLIQKEVVETIGGPVMVVQGIATVGDVVNKKGQVYPWEVWKSNMPNLIQSMNENRLIGEIEHPEKPSLDRTVIKFTKLIQDDKKKCIRFEAEILPTDTHGKNLQILLSRNIPLDISSRGTGTTILQDWNGNKVQVVQPTFKCKTFDIVLNGASPGSTIEDWQLAQSLVGEEVLPEEGTSSLKQDSEENSEMTKEEIEALLGKLLDEKLAGIKPTDQNQSLGDKKPAGKTVEDIVSEAIGNKLEDIVQSVDKIRADFQTTALTQSITAATKEYREGYDPKVANAFESALKRKVEAGQITSVEAFEAFKGEFDAVTQDTLGESAKVKPTGIPGGHTWVKRTAGEINYDLTPNKVIERLIEGMSDKCQDGSDPDEVSFLQSADEDGRPVNTKIPDYIKTPKRQLRQILRNIVSFKDPASGFDGAGAMKALIAMEQGRTEAAKDILNQSFHELTQTVPTGATGVGAGGAPTSQLFIFQLYRRAYPRLILPEIASVQPMDRPDGKIFFLDHYKVATGSSETDEESTTISNRSRFDLGSANAYDETYSDDPGEFGTANYIQLRLSSRSVTAEAKKLAAYLSIEETQDLAAYHGLDAQQELMDGLALDMALAWNHTGLSELLSGAVHTRSYAVTAPSGYTTQEWEAYLSRYVNAISSDIFKRRNGEMTHIICGADAWLAMSSTFRLAGVPNGENPDMYAGLVFTPFADAAFSSIKVYKTNLWKGINRNKILILRKGSTWSDTPYVWAPYVSYTSPTVVTPDSFTLKQGVMERAAHKVVAGDAVGVVTITTGTGTPIAFPTSS